MLTDFIICSTPTFGKVIPNRAMRPPIPGSQSTDHSSEARDSASLALLSDGGGVGGPGGAGHVGAAGGRGAGGRAGGERNLASAIAHARAGKDQGRLFFFFKVLRALDNLA